MNLAFFNDPVEHISDINNIGEPLQEAQIRQRRHGDGIIDKNVSVSSGRSFVAVPFDESERTCMSLFHEIAAAASGRSILCRSDQKNSIISKSVCKRYDDHSLREIDQVFSGREDSGSGSSSISESFLRMVRVLDTAESMDSPA